MRIIAFCKGALEKGLQLITASTSRKVSFEYIFIVVFGPSVCQTIFISKTNLSLSVFSTYWFLLVFKQFPQDFASRMLSFQSAICVFIQHHHSHCGWLPGVAMVPFFIIAAITSGLWMILDILNHCQKWCFQKLPSYISWSHHLWLATGASDSYHAWPSPTPPAPTPHNLPSPTRTGLGAIVLWTLVTPMGYSAKQPPSYSQWPSLLHESSNYHLVLLHYKHGTYGISIPPPSE